MRREEGDDEGGGGGGGGDSADFALAIPAAASTRAALGDCLAALVADPAFDRARPARGAC